jgi:outer membrane receptor protein involved in Fe transport
MSLGWRPLPSAEHFAHLTSATATQLSTPSYDQVDLAARWSVTDSLAGRLGVDNLFDEDPLVVGANPVANNTNQASTNAQYYDTLGRRAYVALKMSF